ncbi:MAG: hypothetical protein Q8K85_17955 [Hyphomicrobium sp.]|nr:hypothetical protein [Hyphomicrobium sp.]
MLDRAGPEMDNQPLNSAQLSFVFFDIRGIAAPRSALPERHVFEPAGSA